MVTTSFARIPHEALSAQIDGWLGRYEVIAPVQECGIRRFRPIATGAEAQVAAWLTRIPLKELFLPQTECLYRYEPSTDGTLRFTPAPVPERPRVVFGVRPCDARSLRLLDRVFRETDRPDPTYVARRERTMLVGLACAEPRSVCFCTSVGGSPFGEEGLDLLLVDAGHEYLVKILTPQGAALVTGLPVPDAAEAERCLAQARARAEGLMTPPVGTAGLQKRLKAGFADPAWKEIHEPCIGCGICAFLCPTCHCFDLVHEEDPHTVAGQAASCIRAWDTCMFSLFTRQASGVNPRPSGMERMRQRLMHKFDYFVENFGEAACVGCGRCIAHCPAGCDIRDSIARVQASENPSPAQPEG